MSVKPESARFFKISQPMPPAPTTNILAFGTSSLVLSLNTCGTDVNVVIVFSFVSKIRFYSGDTKNLSVIRFIFAFNKKFNLKMLSLGGWRNKQQEHKTRMRLFLCCKWTQK